MPRLGAGTSEEVDRFLAWAEGPPFLGDGSRLLQPAVLVLTGSIWVLLALFAAGIVEAALWLVPVVLGLGAVVRAGLAHPAHGWIAPAAGQRALARYGHLLEHAVRAPRIWTCALGAFTNRLTADWRRRARAACGSCNRILGFGELRHSAGIFHFPIQALTLWDFHVVFALERWRAEAGSHVRGWFEAVAELDALAVLAAFGATTRTGVDPGRR